MRVLAAQSALFRVGGFLGLWPAAPAKMASFEEDAADDAALESLGYKQELARGLTMLCAPLLRTHMRPWR